MALIDDTILVLIFYLFIRVIPNTRNLNFVFDNLSQIFRKFDKTGKNGKFIQFHYF